MPKIRIATLLILLTLHIPALCHADWSIIPTENNAVYTGAGDQDYPLTVPDGTGGVIVVWTQTYAFEPRLYAQRIDADGNLLWNPNGVQVCSFDSFQYFFDAVSDDAGGVIIVWEDQYNTSYHIYSQRITPDGVPVWAADGQPVCTITGNQFMPVAASDDNGGVVVAWKDQRNDIGDIYTQRLDAGGNRLWPVSGVLVCGATNGQFANAVVGDSQGGAVIVWEDERTSGPIVYARRVNYLGTPLWNDDGNLVNSSSSPQFIPQIVRGPNDGFIISWLEDDETFNDYRPNAQRLNSAGTQMWGTDGVHLGPGGFFHDWHLSMIGDGLGGAFFAWGSSETTSYDIVAQHITIEGMLDWTANGKMVCDQGYAQSRPQLISDDTGGAIITWIDHRFGGELENNSVYAQRLDYFGNELWQSQGQIISQGTVDFRLTAVSDQRGGIIATWIDRRNSTMDVFTQRLDDTGYLGSPDPALTAVTDFPNDQGGEVTLNWTASYLDAMPWHAVNSYSVWGRLEETKLVVEPAKENHQQLSTKLNIAPEKLDDYAKSGWTFLQQIPAMLSDEYACLAPTYGDSTSLGIIWSEYRVVGHGDDPWITWESTPVSGYSVDNLTPGAPVALTGQWQDQTEVSLNWQAAGIHDEDLALYRIYRGTTLEFPLDEAHLIGTSFTEDYLDPSGTGTWFFAVTAVDVHDNESPGSGVVEMGSVSAAPGPVLRDFALHANYPNPFNPSTCISFAMPQPAQVELTVYSVSGSRVVTLVRGHLSAGSHDFNWHGTNDQGLPVAAGVYTYQLKVGDFKQTRTMVLVK